MANSPHHYSNTPSNDWLIDWLIKWFIESTSIDWLIDWFDLIQNSFRQSLTFKRGKNSPSPKHRPENDSKCYRPHRPLCCVKPTRCWCDLSCERDPTRASECFRHNLPRTLHSHRYLHWNSNHNKPRLKKKSWRTRSIAPVITSKFQRGPCKWHEFHPQLSFVLRFDAAAGPDCRTTPPLSTGKEKWIIRTDKTNEFWRRIRTIFEIRGSDLKAAWKWNRIWVWPINQSINRPIASHAANRPTYFLGILSSPVWLRETFPLKT